MAVRSFVPLVAAVDSRYYGRVASAPFSLAPGRLADFHTHFTVGWYAQGGAGAPSSAADGASPPPPPLLSRALLEAAAAAEGWDWAAADAAMHAALRELFAAAAARVGPFPAGRALYGCDILFEQAAPSADGAPAPVLQPCLLEVNFCGDLATLLKRVPGGAPAFVDDALGYLFACEDEAGRPPPGGCLRAL